MRLLGFEGYLTLFVFDVHAYLCVRGFVLKPRDAITWHPRETLPVAVYI